MTHLQGALCLSLRDTRLSLVNLHDQRGINGAVDKVNKGVVAVARKWSREHTDGVGVDVERYGVIRRVIDDQRGINGVRQQSWMTHLREGLCPSLRNGPGGGGGGEEMELRVVGVSAYNRGHEEMGLASATHQALQTLGSSELTHLRDALRGYGPSPWEDPSLQKPLITHPWDRASSPSVYRSNPGICLARLWCM